MSKSLYKKYAICPCVGGMKCKHCMPPADSEKGKHLRSVLNRQQRRREEREAFKIERMYALEELKAA